MSDWNLSIVMIVPAELQDQANRISCALDYDVLPGNTFSVALSVDGSEPATHYGCRTSAKQEFVDILNQAGSGNLPEIEWSDFDLTPDDVAAVLGALIIDVRPDDQVTGHFDDVMAARELR
ncbi:hypothetical protein ACFPLB_04400 [Aquamicrobium segne]|uniref:Uncharacterized protein n=1 Tax=Aquamicrobium segne TaxID=469547 RepID=A0ABW0GU70_9HYPH